MVQPMILKLAVIVFPEMTPLDFLGATTMFSLISASRPASLPDASSTLLDVHYVGHTLEKIVTSGGPNVLADRTFAEVAEAGDQYDIIFAPGGTFGFFSAVSSPH
jgi:putative intracellular protease/amidase